MKEFIDMQHSEVTGKRRSENTMESYSTTFVWFRDKLFKQNYNINVLAFNLNGKSGVALKESKKAYKRLRDKIITCSASNSINTLNSRLKMVAWVLAKAEKDYNIKTGKEYFKAQKNKDNEVIVIDQDLHKKTFLNALQVAKTQVYKGAKEKGYLGSLIYILLSITGSRIGDMRQWSFSKNVIFDSKGTSFLVFKDQKVKYKTIEIPLPGPVAEILKAHQNKSTDTIFHYYSYVHLSTCFKEFLMTIPDFHKEQIVSKANAAGVLKTEKKPLYKIYTPHKLRSTFITQMIESGADLDTVMSFSGHKSVKTLSNRYTNVSRNHRIKTYNNYLNQIIDV